MTAYTVFRAKDGAIVDLLGLKAISEEPGRYLRSILMRIAPDLPAVIIDGLEPSGKLPKKQAVPGLMSFQPSSFSVSPGSAILPDDRGELHLVQIVESLMIENDEPDKSDALRILVLSLEHEPGSDDQGQKCAYEVFTPKVHFVRQGSELPKHFLPIARELAPKIWSTDIARMMQPDHPALQNIMLELDELEEVIWNADRHGLPWDDFRLGREWQTYQTKASVAVTSTRMTLSFRPSSSMDRARALTNLQWQLQRSVEDAARHLRDWIGIAEASGVYESMFSAFPESWDRIEG